MVVQIPIGRGNFEAGNSALSCAKTAEPIEMRLGLWTRVGPRKHVSHMRCTLAQSGEYD